jgi:hypothetical protein
MQHLMPSLKLLNFKHKLFCNNCLHLINVQFGFGFGIALLSLSNAVSF